MENEYTEDHHDKLSDKANRVGKGYTLCIQCERKIKGTWGDMCSDCVKTFMPPEDDDASGTETNEVREESGSTPG